MESRSILDKRLRDTFGYIDGKARFRLVWSEDLYETRLQEYSEAGIFLGYKEARRARKYSYIKDRYIIEAYVPFIHPDILTDDKFSYENIYTFQGKDRQPLPPIWEVCEIIGKHFMDILNKKIAYYHKESHYQDLATERLDKEKSESFDILQHEAPLLQQGVTVPSNYNSEMSK